MTSGACLTSNRKPSSGIALGRDPIDVDAAHARAGWSVVRPCDERVDCGALALGLGRDAAVGLVRDPTGDAEPARLLLHGAAIPDALDAAADDETCAHCHQSPRRARNASSSSVG